MPDLSSLTSVQLHGAERACQFLLQLHRNLDVLDYPTRNNLDTLLSDIRAAQEDKQQAERRQRITDAARRAAVPEIGVAQANRPRIAPYVGVERHPRVHDFGEEQ